MWKRLVSYVVVINCSLNIFARTNLWQVKNSFFLLDQQNHTSKSGLWVLLLITRFALFTTDFGVVYMLQDSTRGDSLPVTWQGSGRISVNPTVFAIVYLTYSLKFGILVVSMYWLISKKRSSDVTGNSWLSSPPLLCPHLALWSRLPGLTCNLNKAFRHSHICWFLGVYKFYQIYCKSIVSLSK